MPSVDLNRLTSKSESPTIRLAYYVHPTDTLGVMAAPGYWDAAWSALPKNTIIEVLSVTEAQRVGAIVTSSSKRDGVVVLFDAADIATPVFAGAGDYNPLVPSSGTDNGTMLAAALSTTGELELPRGNFKFSGFAVLQAVLASTIVGPGKLFYDNGSTVEQIGSVYRAGVCDFDGNLGSNTQGGVLFGGEGPGVDGVLGRGQQPAWIDFLPTRYGSAIEFQIYNNCHQGLAQSVIGTGYIDATYVDFASNNIAVGDVIGFGTQVYRIKTKVSTTRLELQTVAGGAVAFGSSTQEMWSHAYTYADGLCNVSGTTLSRVSGDYFFTIAAYQSEFKVVVGADAAGAGGTVYPATWNSVNQLTLGSSGGSLTNVRFTLKAMSLALGFTTLRLQGIKGSVETNFTIEGTIDNRWRVKSQATTATGAKYMPIEVLMGSNQDNPGSVERSALTINADHRIGIGWDFLTTGFTNDALLHIKRDPRSAAHATDGTLRTRLLSLETLHQASGHRRIDFGNIGNFNCGYIQGWADPADTVTGRLAINPFGGQVGIGTGSRTAFNDTFEVVGGVYASGTVRSQTMRIVNTNTQAIKFEGGSGPGWRVVSTINGATDGDVVLQHSTDNFVANFTNALTLTKDGYVKPAGLTNAVNDAAAATASVPVGALYRNGSAVQVRVS